MANGWHVEPLADVADMLSGGTPKKSNQSYWNGSIPWLTPKDMGQWSGVTAAKVSPEAIGNGTRLAPKEAIFVAVRGMSLHNEIRVIRSDDALTFNQDIKAIVAKKSINPLYLYYVLVSKKPELLDAVEAAGHGTGRLPTDKLKDLLVPRFPALAEAALAEIFCTLDDKIELNRRMNETLEAMARAIFKDWFVDFGPTRAKSEGREPYLAPDLWNLFPDALDDEDKPEGCRKGTLADVADSPKRGISPADVAEDTPYIGLEHMPRRSIALSEWEGAGKVTSNKSVFKKGEFLFGKLRPYFHKIGFAPMHGICSTDIVVVVPRAPEWGAFTLACLSSDEFVDYTDQTSTGTKMPRTSWKTMGQYKLCLPSEQVASAFQRVAQPLLDSVNANICESHTLAQTRDLLLPKLMSGEIRLAEAEKVVEVVA